MKVHVNINEEIEETLITIQAKEWTDELEELMKRMKSPRPERLIGMKDEQTILLKPENVDYVFSEKRKNYAVTANGRSS
ncbi:hypothetical protein ACQCVE_12640 [Metabacillus sp. 113a]|uniref:hypothetical protein n=1 Tax=Metabacillus sp. 113a TaxID=3404706 RepID=UPI003CF72685